MTTSGTTIAAALKAARSRIPAAEASLLLAEAGGYSRAWLIAHDDDVLPDAVSQRFDDWLARRERGEPVAYILGWREFYGHRFAVAPGVLIPRPETELLVEQGLAAIVSLSTPRILDLGTGSGCIAVSLALARPDARVWAVDFSAEALAIATANAERLGAKVEFVRSDWAASLSVRDFDLIVSNPPYIAPDDAHLTQGDLRFEPRTALAAADAGLADLRHIVAVAEDLLAPGGMLLCEHGYDQAGSMQEVIVGKGFSPVRYCDLAGIVRVSGGRMAEAQPPGPRRETGAAKNSLGT
ncbi:MAG: peptide chain release factor N(5)-glutamine methyltransferase [Rhodocyclaceae bacterium]|nr:peptide chain release factor N(5)-glutamine methyltransferase [Rhodocyclaceae bacterium]